MANFMLGTFIDFYNKFAENKLLIFDSKMGE